MTTEQKSIIRELIEQSYDSGFHHYPLAPIAAKLGITEPLYDNNTNTGLLWKLGRHGCAVLDINTEGTHAAVSRFALPTLERQCGVSA